MNSVHHLPKFHVDIIEPVVRFCFKRCLTSSEMDMIEIYFKHLCMYFCDLPQFCFDEEKMTLDILIKDPSEYRNFSIFAKLLSLFYALSPTEKLYTELNHYRCINKMKFRGNREEIFQKSQRGFIIRYLLNSLFYESEDHWIIKQNQCLVNKITNKSILTTFNEFEKILPIDISKPQIVITCAMISDFLPESKELLNTSFGVSPDAKVVPFWNMFLDKSKPIPHNVHSQMILIMDIEEKLTLMANKNIQWWVLFDFSMGLTDLYDEPKELLPLLSRSPSHLVGTAIEHFVKINKFNLLFGMNDVEPSISILLTFAHYRDFFQSSPLNLDLTSRFALTTIYESILELLNKSTKIDANHYFIKQLLEQKINKPTCQNKHPPKQKSRLWSDLVASDEDVDNWEDWESYQEDDVWADEA